MRVQNKVIVVTGGGNGIGRELALNLLARGAHVVAIDIQDRALQDTVALAKEKAGNLATFSLDITDRAQVEALPAQVIARFGAVDGLINNAGIIQPFVKLHALDDKAIERVMHVNFYGTLYMIRAFLPHLLQRPEAHIVNISSMGGFLPVPGQTVYGASKAAVKLLTEGLHAELLNTHVRVTVVFPGAVGTEIAKNSGLGEIAIEGGKKIRVLPPSKAAQRILDGMEKNRYRILVGQDAKFMDFLYRLSPGRAARLIYKQMQSLLPE